MTLEDYERFCDYGCEHGAWGSLHIALSDGNLEDWHIEHCRTFALEEGDREGADLAVLLLAITEDERRDLYASLHGGYRPWAQP